MSFHLSSLVPLPLAGSWLVGSALVAGVVVVELWEALSMP